MEVRLKASLHLIWHGELSLAGHDKLLRAQVFWFAKTWQTSDVLPALLRSTEPLPIQAKGVYWSGKEMRLIQFCNRFRALPGGRSLIFVILQRKACTQTRRCRAKDTKMM
jgi:hypothetical protein